MGSGRLDSNHQCFGARLSPVLQSYFNYMRLCVWPEVLRDGFGSRTEMCCLGHGKGMIRKGTDGEGSVKFLSPLSLSVCVLIN